MKTILVASIAALAVSAPVYAADLVIQDEVAPYVDPVVSGFYAQFLGGVALGGTLDHNEDGSFDHDHDLAAGYAVAGVIGYEFIDGFAFELDALLTSREIDEEDDFLSTASLMAGLRFTVDVTDSVALYAGAAVGGIWTEDEMWEGDSSGWGYQLKAGVEVEVLDNVALVGEYRYQAPFSELPFDEDGDEANDFGTSAVLAGVRLSF